MKQITKITQKEAELTAKTEIYKKCVFEKFLNNKCEVIATNIGTGYSWMIKEYEIDILEPMILNKNFDLFPIPKCFFDDKIIVKA